MPTYPAAPPAAQEILERDRSYLLGLKAKGWRNEISRVERLLTSEADRKKWEKEWSRLGDFDTYRRTSLDFPVVDVIEHKTEGVNIPALALPALLVKLTAPDELILRQMEVVLKQWRKKNPFAVSKPGRKAANAIFDRKYICGVA
jgi:hypothetical protein